MGAVGFEPTKAEPSDLQSDPFVHFGTRPQFILPRVLRGAELSPTPRKVANYGFGGASFREIEVDREVVGGLMLLNGPGNILATG